MRSELQPLGRFLVPRQIGETLIADGRGDRSMTTSSFAAVIKIRGINPFILVSASRANSIKPGWRKPLPVLVRINGKPEEPWHINMMPAGDGCFYLYLCGDLRKASGTDVGDRGRGEVKFG